MKIKINLHVIRGRLSRFGLLVILFYASLFIVPSGSTTTRETATHPRDQATATKASVSAADSIRLADTPSSRKVREPVVARGVSTEPNNMRSEGIWKDAGHTKTDWIVEDTGTSFEITGSKYLNITLTSSDPVHVLLESVPKIISFSIESIDSTLATQVTLSGFDSYSPYYRYQDGYLMEPFTTDATGQYAYTQDLTQRHHVYIQEKPATLYINSDFTFSEDIYEDIVVAADNIVIDGNGYSLINNTGIGYGFYLNGRSNVTIKNVTVTGWSTSIYLWNSANNSIEGNTLTNTQMSGIGLYSSSSKNNITSNTCTNTRFGIYLPDAASNNSLVGNIINNATDYGIWLWDSANNNSLVGNTITIAEHGIRLTYAANNNSITGNTITYTQEGIRHVSSANNTIAGNTIANSTLYGISLWSSADNVIYHNNFINNSAQAYDNNAANNDWYHPSLLEGNYWSNYPGEDDGSGNRPVGDGIGDTDIPWYYDNYPLMEQSLYISSDYTFTEDLHLVVGIRVLVDDIVIDGNGYTLQGSGIRTGITLTDRRNVTITDVTVTEWATGINLERSSKNRIVDNTVTNITQYGIKFSQSAYNNISSNTLTKTDTGIYFATSTNNRLAGNTLTNTSYEGIVLWNSATDNTLTGNTLINTSWKGIVLWGSGNNNTLVGNTINITEYGINLASSVNNTIVGNTVTNTSSYGIRLESMSTNNNITGNTLINTSNSIGLFSSSNNSISGNTLTNIPYGPFTFGIYLESSSNISVVGNTLTNITHYGIRLQASSNNNTIAGNTLTNTGYDGIRLHVNNNFNNIVGNTITTAFDSGIWLETNCAYNNIVGNTITNATDYGIRLWSSSNNNNLTGNTIINTTQYGMGLSSGSINNVIYHNNFINNTVQAIDGSPASNDWHHPGMLEGNYWSDYPGVDDGSGTGKHAIAGDGIGDTAIPWPTTDFDFYPFVHIIDFIQPAAITDLVVSNPTTNSLTLTWTAPGDDGMTGTATGYEVRYSTAGPIVYPEDNMLWNLTYGGSGDDVALSIIETADGGFTLAGRSSSFGAGDYDAWLVKTDADGTPLWNQTYGNGTSDDSVNDVIETADGGFALVGLTYVSAANQRDFWLVKTFANGTEEWNQTYGGPGHENANTVIQTTDGGFALVGYTNSYGAGGNAWLVKTDVDGNHLWNQTYGGLGSDFASSIIQTMDHGFALAGYSASYGDYDTWLVKTDVAGNPQWNQTYAGLGYEDAMSIIQTADGGFALAGSTYNYSEGWYDAWLVKTDASGVLQWNQTYGGSNEDWGYDTIQTLDGGFLLAGYTKSYGAGADDGWLVKTDVNGVPQWNQTYGGSDQEHVYAIIDTSDGGFALAGLIWSFATGNSDLLLVKTVPHPWYTVLTYTQAWTPKSGGTLETYVVSGLNPNTQYWFAIRAYDDGLNYGWISNCLSGSTKAKPKPPPGDGGDGGDGGPPPNKPPTVTLTFPNGGEILTGEVTVTWEASDPDNKPNQLSFTLSYKDEVAGTDWVLLAEQLAEPSYLWDTTTVPDGFSYRVQVIATDSKATAADESDAPFSIDNVNLPPEVEVLSPNGGEEWTGTQRIHWEARDPDAHALTYTVQYSLDGGVTWLDLASGLETPYYDWDTTQVADSSTFVIRVVASDGILIGEDSSDATFTIANILLTPEPEVAEFGVNGVLVVLALVSAVVESLLLLLLTRRRRK